MFQFCNDLTFPMRDVRFSRPGLSLLWVSLLPGIYFSCGIITGLVELQVPKLKVILIFHLEPSWAIGILEFRCGP